MKKTLFITLFGLILFPVILFAQSGGGKLELTDIKSSQVKWNVDSYDFGEIKQNIPVDATFELENTGNAPLIIQNVKASCGCTTADYQKSPIMPGQKATVGATFDAKKLGKFSKSLTVTLNDGSQPYILRFTGTVIAE